MSNFLLGVLGAAIGSAFGMPALGFTLGMGLGGLGHHGHSSSAARLSDLKVQTSTVGVPIPRLYGTYRLAGNLIWAQDIIARSDHNNIHYYGYFAIGLCAGPIAGITRIWAEDKLILGHATSPEIIQCPTWLRLYLGDETQQADPLLESQYGKGEVPAFRGLAYFVVENLNLTSFNNRLPTFTIEVVQNAATLLPQPIVEPVEKKKERKRGRLRDLPVRPLASTFTIPASHYPKKQVAAPAELSSIVLSLCEQAGLAPDLVDVSLLKEKVSGFILAQSLSIRDALGLLQQAYFFDGLESEGGLKWIPRGQGLPTVIPEDYLGAVEEGQPPSPLLLSTQTRGAMRSVTLFFNDRLAHYQLATQTAQRQGTASTRVEKVELPLALDSAQAARIADQLLWEAEATSTQYEFSLSQRYATLEPTDVVIIQNHRMRIVGIDAGRPGLLKIKAVREDSNIYNRCADSPPV